MAVCSSSGDISWACERAHHRRLDAHTLGHQLRPDAHISVDVDRRDAVRHEQLDLDNLDREQAARGCRQVGECNPQCIISDKHAAELVHIRRYGSTLLVRRNNRGSGVLVGG